MCTVCSTKIDHNLEQKLCIIENIDVNTLGHFLLEAWKSIFQGLSF